MVSIPVWNTITFMGMDSDCDPVERAARPKSILTELYFNGSGNFFARVERTAIGIDIFTDLSPDSPCDDGSPRRPCPHQQALVGQIALPDGVSPRVRTVEIEPDRSVPAGFREVPVLCH